MSYACDAIMPQPCPVLPSSVRSSVPNVLGYIGLVLSVCGCFGMDIYINIYITTYRISYVARFVVCVCALFPPHLCAYVSTCIDSHNQANSSTHPDMAVSRL